MNRRSTRKTRVWVFALTVLIALSTPLGLAAQTDDAYLTGSETGDILLADLGAFGGGFAAVGLNFLMMGILGADGELSVAEHVIASSMLELGNIPLFLSGSPDAAGLAAAGTALLGAQVLSDAGYGNYSNRSNFLYWGRVDLTMYRAYDSYASTRLRSPAWDNASFRRYGFLELMAAPLDPRNYAHPQPWIALGAGLGLGVLYALATVPDPWANAVWTTGRWYSGETETTAGAFVLENLATNLVSSAYTGAGEEAVYRGFLHEELSVRLGRGWAMAADTTAFLAMHFFTDLARGMDARSIALHMLSVAGGNLLFDWAYDEGGLPLATVCHMLWDFAYFNLNKLLSGGVPQSARTSL